MSIHSNATTVEEPQFYLGNHAVMFLYRNGHVITDQITVSFTDMYEVEIAGTYAENRKFPNWFQAARRLTQYQNEVALPAVDFATILKTLTPSVPERD